ncbi:hypothetical protein ACSSNL_00695 [Thalassobius sp. S69A]|uniref:hypothetical protein n=1 Tax=unclassified Thalassovita TaxID=2619711 RepID=UPI000C0E9291|nr:hypothetical protein [Paracoccaceae bacterium]MBT25835.1 hypothetical protein [Paracoccaceae bacterium]
MSDRIEVPASETGVVRLFAVDLPADEIEDFADFEREGALMISALGVYDLNPSCVEIFPVAQLDDMGLANYLIEAYSIDPADLKDDRTFLNNIRGHVALVSSGAFRGKAQTLRPYHPLRWLGTWSEPRPQLDLSPIPSDAARDTLGTTGPAERPRFPRWLGWVLPLAGIVLGTLIYLLSPHNG